MSHYLLIDHERGKLMKSLQNEESIKTLAEIIDSFPVNFPEKYIEEILRQSVNVNHCKISPQNESVFK